jgi:pimeloyl-ACP methyl ester carboxylesterase
MGNAQTFVDLRKDPDWATLDLDALSRLPRPVLITTGETSPSWLRDDPRAVAGAARIATLTIAGAGHSPHLSHPDALVAVVDAFARGSSSNETVAGASRMLA